jgi:Domain of unknown function (DUF4202)
MSDARFAATLAAIDAANGEDLTSEIVGGKSVPKELAYSRRMTGWLTRLDPTASEALRLAVRAQHIRRWTVPRDGYPMDRQGYHRWRTALGRFHAETAGALMKTAGYDAVMVERVGSLIRKERLKTDPEAQTLEDVACLVFLENYLADFAGKHDEAKVIDILRKTWRKMSKRGQDAALALDLAPAGKRVLDRALAG